MNGILILIFGAIVVLGGGYYVISDSGRSSGAQSGEVAEVMEKNDAVMSEDAMNKDAAMEKAPEAMEKKDGAMMEKKEAAPAEAMMFAGTYEAYAAEKLAKAESGDVVLFFRALWCPSCKAVDADIRARVASIPKGLAILDVNYDSSADLKKKYGVTYQHTFVQVKADGTMIKKWSGSATLATLVAEVQ